MHSYDIYIIYVKFNRSTLVLLRITYSLILVALKFLTLKKWPETNDTFRYFSPTFRLENPTYYNVLTFISLLVLSPWNKTYRIKVRKSLSFSITRYNSLSLQNYHPVRRFIPEPLTTYCWTSDNFLGFLESFLAATGAARCCVLLLRLTALVLIRVDWSTFNWPAAAAM